MTASEVPPVLCLAGPTAAGKTAVALELAERLPLDLISVDSAMVYRHMDIGTDKPDAATLRRHPHALIDIREPWESYSAGEFREDALRLIDDSHARGRLPLLVGGTLLYFRSLRQGLASLPAADAELRAQIDARGVREGWAALHAELAEVDPAAAARIAVGDRQRIQRALEVFHLTGEPLSELQSRSTSPPSLRFRCVALVPGDRAQMYRRIDARFGQMLELGFEAELRRLFDMPQMHAGSVSMRAVGYRQLWRYVAGETPFARACEQARTATRRYAKRQLTWLRGEPDFAQVDSLGANSLARVVSLFGLSAEAGAL